MVMYHSVGGVGLSPDIVVSSMTFASHLQHLRHHYQLLSLPEAVSLIKARRPLPSNAVVVTLDDGYRDNYQNALPILKQHECPATLFVTIEPLDTGRRLWPQTLWRWLQMTKEVQLRLSWRSQSRGQGAEKILNLRSGDERSDTRAWMKAFAGGLDVEDRQDFLRCVARELRVDDEAHAASDAAMLTWGELREMHRSGITIGSHTVTHPRLSGLEPTGVRRELVESRARLERELATEIPLFAYPFGGSQDYTEHTKLAVQAAGYQAACAGEDVAARDASPDLLALPRVYVPNDPIWRFSLRLLRARQDSRLVEWLLAD
jgi:peptidoglycan/xylan/chitin deacetylase (PgdA/CDA1 family)